jgi:Flp pilus assembly protein TadD
MSSVIKVRDKAGRSRLLSLDEALAEASRDLAAGQHSSALLILERAVRAAPFNPRARYLLGASQANNDNWKDATYNLNKAAEADPQNADYRASLALALLRENPADAVPHLFAAIDLGSTNPDVFTNLTLILLTLRRDQDVLKVSELGLAACHEHFALLGNRGVALRHLGRYEESLECCRRQLELQAHDARVWSNMGCILTELGSLDESEQAHAQACRLDPQNAGAHFNLAFTLLMNRKFHEGFREYEWRWHTPGLKSEWRNFPQPLWDGSPLAGKQILLHAEQGAGDTIQFSRYLPLVEALGGRITCEVARSLVRLMGFLPGQHRVVVAGSPLGDFAVHCPLMSLPLKFATEPSSIPPPIPFAIPEEMKAQWAHRLSGGKAKVALVWAGSPTQRDDRTRSLPFRSLLPLMNLDSTDFFSLQVGERGQDLKNAGLSDRIRDLSPYLTDFAETAAALSCMDLVISVDTSVAHLAGTLGRPLWLLTSFAPDWRWLRDRSDSPWYPSMRLFRQPAHGDWDTVIAEVLAALQGEPA